MGLVHPISGTHYRYVGLPMGASNSPAIAGRLGASFTRLLISRYAGLFGGTPRANTWASRASTENCYDPRLGHGRALIGSDSLPAGLMWAHVDDWLVHAPTLSKAAACLTAFMDTALLVGLVCNPDKISPPSQVVKYCGFLYDTTSVPTLRIPLEKRDRATAIISWAAMRRGRPISRLCVAVMVGVLQSLVPATPSNLGQSFLRRLHSVMADSEESDPRLKFYTMVTLDDGAWADLDWWRAVLRLAVNRPGRPVGSDALRVRWGDGSGTGTGGTREDIGAPVYRSESGMEMWMGTWSPDIIHYSSNKKELQTLILSLEAEVTQTISRGRPSAVRDMSLLYFTDNTTVYYVVGNGTSKNSTLQTMVHRVKYLELCLGCHLEVVHVPGTLMITQGTDGLSRGVWISSLHQASSSRQLLPELFAPARCSPDLLSWMLSQFPSVQIDMSRAWTYVAWDSPWDALSILGQATVWCPPPEMASQAISSLMNLFVENPTTTTALILVPRILQRSWGQLSNYITELAVLPLPWAPSTLLQYNGKLSIVSKFGRLYGVQILAFTPMDAPPRSHAIPLQWAIQHYAIQPVRHSRRTDPGTDSATVSYGTVRGLRSAVSMFHRLDMQTSNPGQAYFDGNDRALIAVQVSPTDEMSSVLMNKGMRNRMGDSSRPAEALVESYVLFLDRSLDARFQAAIDPALRLELARAGTANATCWLGWLRSLELFGVLCNEVELVTPRDSPRFALPLGISMILYRLKEETKENRSQTADVVLAGTAGSGLSPYK
jgi:hypothetical protein